ncbi:hypothetical protein BC938DRAFT_472612 [Jimgerdemannia flammicorona]|uniref:K Homology domain-containing protein n=1 Tax=Jimgerdemannia flammicorona TaxID=994334 RepID=A0A433Q5R1_9FUNG|nr:hypothetical protein BC938DRAFT_472612 [Jimgerdemannia flammicorona]
MLAEKGIPIPPKVPQVMVSNWKRKDLTNTGCQKRLAKTTSLHRRSLGATQTQIQKDTGADVTTRGKYYPDKNLATDEHPPLYLHVTAVSQDSLDAAVAKIEELIEQAFNPPSSVSRAPQGPPERPSAPRQFLQTKVFVGIDPDRSFNVRAKIVGPQGAYVKHIQSETGAKVQLKGRGSGFVEPTSGTEAFEPLHLHITCYQQDGLERAQKLSEDLINTVKAEYERTRQERGQYGGYGRPGQNRQPQYGASGYSVPPPPPGSYNYSPVSPGNTQVVPANPPLPPGPPPPANIPSLPPHNAPPPASPTVPTATSPTAAAYPYASAYGSAYPTAYPAYNNPYNYSGYYYEYPTTGYYGEAAPSAYGDGTSTSSAAIPSSSTAPSSDPMAWPAEKPSYHAVPPPTSLQSSGSSHQNDGNKH